jgi:hypothetical protein
MKSRAFNETFANFLGLELKAVTVAARRLKEAGLMTSGARGVNAPDMTAMDAARITIAFLSGDKLVDVADRVRAYGSLRFRPDLSSNQVDVLGRESTFEEALELMFSDYDEPIGHSYVEVDVKERIARIENRAGELIFLSDVWSDEDSDSLYGIRVKRGLSSPHWFLIKLNLNEANSDLVDAEARKSTAGENEDQIVIADPGHNESAS